MQDSVSTLIKYSCRLSQLSLVHGMVVVEGACNFADLPHKLQFQERDYADPGNKQRLFSKSEYGKIDRILTTLQQLRQRSSRTGRFCICCYVRITKESADLAVEKGTSTKQQHAMFSTLTIAPKVKTIQIFAVKLRST